MNDHTKTETAANLVDDQEQTENLITEQSAPSPGEAEARVWVDPPDPTEVDTAFEAQPWILRKRITWEGYVFRCGRAGVMPDRRKWFTTQGLTDEELQLLDDLVEAKRYEFSGQDFNDKFFIREFGNKARVGWLDGDGELVVMSVPEFHTAHIEKNIEIPTSDGKSKIIPLTKHWLQHPLTRRYDCVEFLPGVEEPPAGILNLWRGWPVGLEPGWKDVRLSDGVAVPTRDGPLDGHELPWLYCERFLDHMANNMCQGDEAVLEYLLAWVADALWNHGPAETAIVLRGPQGSGKSLWAQCIMEFFGRPHSITLSRPEQLVGNFNKHLMNKSIVFADEAFFAGNAQHAAALKTLVTDPDLFVEPKGVDGFKVKKKFRLILASNDEQVIRAERDDRRYLVLNVDAGEKNQNKAYFNEMMQEWREGGRRAFFRWLTGAHWGAMVKGRFADWERPVTQGLDEQKELSLAPGDEFILSILESAWVDAESPRSGRPGTFYGNGRGTPPNGLFDMMRRSVPKLRNCSDRALANILRKWGAVPGKSGDRYWILLPPPEMRARWESHYGPRDWADDAREWNAASSPASDPSPF